MSASALPTHPWPRGGPPARVAVVGTRGYGVSHLASVAKLAAEGKVVLVAVADPVAPQAGTLPPDISAFGSLNELLASVEVDIVTVATPIHTHYELARMAIEAGADVLLEKPPTASRSDFDELVTLSQALGRHCQVGFQSLGSRALPALDELTASGQLGEIAGVGGFGAWVRSTDYWNRSAWAGRRTLGPHQVLDGAVTNPFAHAVVAALRLAGSVTADDVAAVHTELYRANEIEADDTSVVTITTTAGVRVVLGLTLSAASDRDPTVTVYGSKGRATLHYVTDEVLLSLDGAAPTVQAYERTNLLANLVEHRIDPAVELLAPLARTGAFMQVLEAVRLAPDPAPIPADQVLWILDNTGRHPVVRDVEHWLQRASTELRPLHELGAPWADAEPFSSPTATGPPSLSLMALSIDGRVVADYVDGSALVPSSCPRPYLHPVRTLAGTSLTDSEPADHEWHLGAGVAISDVGRHNFWGGRTYLRDRGYQWRQDHGRIEHRGFLTRAGSEAVEELEWRAVDGAVVLHERRTLRWTGVDADIWALDLGFSLSPAASADVVLGSPGSHGRLGGGYGGFFWRLAPCRQMTVFTPTTSGAESAHGSVAPWLAIAARFAGGPATLVVTATDDVSASDPWFVRQADYPGFGSSLAWDEPVVASVQHPVERAFRVYLADGILDHDRVASLARAQ